MIRRCLRAAAWLLAIYVTATIAIVVVLRWLDPPATMVMLLEPGELRDLEHRWLGREAIAVAAAEAVIAAEDQKFLDHFGFDLDQLGEALEDYRDGGELRGASTISQQVAKNLFLWNGRSFVRKGLEAYCTVLIEALWSKERILEVYLNVAEFGPGIFGVGAAAERLLGVPASGLSRVDAALLAAVLPSPKRLLAQEPSAYVRARQAAILRQMELLGRRGHYAGLAW